MQRGKNTVSTGSSPYIKKLRFVGIRTLANSQLPQNCH